MPPHVNSCSCPPRTFLPALCNIFLDQTATPQILEVTARALTYYLDVSSECAHRIVGVDGAVAAIADRLNPPSDAVSLDRVQRDLAEQCVKVWHFLYLL